MAASLSGLRKAYFLHPLEDQGENDACMQFDPALRRPAEIIHQIERFAGKTAVR